MNKIFTICMFELKRLFLKPASYVIMFGMPLLFTFIFGSFVGDNSSNEKLKLALVDNDKTTISSSYFENIKNSEFFNVSKTNESAALKQLENKDISGVIYLNKGFEHEIITGNSPIIPLKHSADFTSSAAIERILNNSITTVKLHAKASTDWANYSGGNWTTMYTTLTEQFNDSPKLINKEILKKNDSKSNMSSRAAGFTIMFVMIVMMSVTGTFLEAKKIGVWYRLLTTPLSRLELLLGLLFSFFLIGWIQFGVLMLATSIIFSISWGNAFAIFILVSSLILCVVGLGLFIASFVKTTEQQAALGNIIIISTCMLGGVYWPLEIVPEFMQKMANFVPQTWAMEGFNQLVTKGGGLTDILLPIVVLLGFAVVFLSIGISRVKYE